MIVIVHGYDGSEPGHWQRWLHDELRAAGADVVFPDLPAPTAPEKDAWVAALAGVEAPRVHAALLVAPPSPLLPFEPVESFLPPPRRRAAWAPFAARTLVVGSDDDDYASADEITETARVLGSAHRIIPGAGHINVASGYGPWPFVVEWLSDIGAR